MFTVDIIAVVVVVVVRGGGGSGSSGGGGDGFFVCPLSIITRKQFQRISSALRNASQDTTGFEATLVCCSTKVPQLEIITLSLE